MGNAQVHCRSFYHELKLEQWRLEWAIVVEMKRKEREFQVSLTGGIMKKGEIDY